MWHIDTQNTNHMWCVRIDELAWRKNLWKVLNEDVDGETETLLRPRRRVFLLLLVCPPLFAHFVLNSWPSTSCESTNRRYWHNIVKFTMPDLRARTFWVSKWKIGKKKDYQRSWRIRINYNNKEEHEKCDGIDEGGYSLIGQDLHMILHFWKLWKNIVIWRLGRLEIFPVVAQKLENWNMNF